MAATLAQVTADAFALPPAEREQLAERLLESIVAAEDDAPPGAGWEETRHRIEEIDGGIETIDAEEVFAKLRAKQP